jgi:hypothetical protein
MSWKKKAEIEEDVVCFTYAELSPNKSTNECYVWDLDKTYLDTKYESFWGLWRTIFEKAYKKKNIPGTAAMVRALQDYYQLKNSTEEFPIFFITASPPQMEAKIVEKLNLDGIQPLRIYCKDNLRNLHPRRFSRLTQHVGYKLQSLLQIRSLFPQIDLKQVLWGDDSEADVIIYCLYSDICARRIGENEIRKILDLYSVPKSQTVKILRLIDEVPHFDPVDKIYINLAEDTDVEYYLKYGRRVVPSFNSFEVVIDMYQDKRIGINNLVNVAEDLLRRFDFTIDQIEKSLNQLIKRKILSSESLPALSEELKKRNLLRKQWKPEAKVFSTQEIAEQHDPWIPEYLDYL